MDGDDGGSAGVCCVDTCSVTMLALGPGLRNASAETISLPAKTANGCAAGGNADRLSTPSVKKNKQ